VTASAWAIAADAEEAVEGLLAGLREVAVGGMAGGVFHVHRFGARAHQAHQAFVGAQAYATDGVGAQALGGHEHALGGGRVDEVDGTGVGADDFAHAPDDEAQGLIQVLGAADFLGEFTQGFQHGDVRHRPGSG